jgi:hypothetical protein
MINQGMKKAWIYIRKGIRGWWVGWYESGKRKTKALPTKALAEHYRKIKYVQLNSDVFTGSISVDWPKMRDEYLHSKKVAGCVDESIYEVALTMRHFERLIGKNVIQDRSLKVLLTSTFWKGVKKSSVQRSTKISETSGRLFAGAGKTGMSMTKLNSKN